MMESRIALIPQVRGVAGPAAFRRRLAAGLEQRGYKLCSDLKHPGCRSGLVIGGTRGLGALYAARRRGVHLVQRLDGLNWIHRQTFTNPLHFLRAEFNNLLLRVIRRFLVDQVVYQSQFARQWWHREHGPAGQEEHVIHNGVPLDQYNPEGPGSPPGEYDRILVVEANFLGGYQRGLEPALRLVAVLQGERGREVVLTVAGSVPNLLRERMGSQAGGRVEWLGLIPPDRVPELHRSSHLLYSSDVNPACPNAVIEAMASGLPVLAYSTGALPELVREGAGILVPYGGDPWQLDPPEGAALVEAALELLSSQEPYRRKARAQAERSFSLEDMVDRYLQLLG